METVTVPSECRLAGKTLLDLDLIRRVGVQIAGIRRGDQRVLAPAGREMFNSGDELLVLGTPPQIAGFREFLVPRESGVGTAA
jgi:CPA2 family monovalent cation:H+ antiporter-2